MAQRLAYAAAELADAFTVDEDPNVALFDLLLDTVGRLDTGQPSSLAMRYYELHLLALVGYQPQLFHCVHCNRPLEPVVNFLSLDLRRLPCPQHGANVDGTIALPLDVLKVLRYLQAHPWDRSRCCSCVPRCSRRWNPSWRATSSIASNARCVRRRFSKSCAGR